MTKTGTEERGTKKTTSDQKNTQEKPIRAGKKETGSMKARFNKEFEGSKAAAEFLRVTMEQADLKNWFKKKKSDTDKDESETQKQTKPSDEQNDNQGTGWQ